MTSFPSASADEPPSVQAIRNNKTGAILQDAFQAFDLLLARETA